jgi:hypothetical protein
MATLSRDTSPEIERVMIELLRQKTTAERIEMAACASQGLFQIAAGAIRNGYPNAGEQERRSRLAARWLGREWAIRLFNWDPEEHGW